MKTIIFEQDEWHEKMDGSLEDIVVLTMDAIKAERDVRVVINEEFIVEAKDGEIVHLGGEHEGIVDYDEYHNAFNNEADDDIEGREDYKDEIRNDFFFTGLREF